MADNQSEENKFNHSTTMPIKGFAAKAGLVGKGAPPHPSTEQQEKKTTYENLDSIAKEAKDWDDDYDIDTKTPTDVEKVTKTLRDILKDLLKKYLPKSSKKLREGRLQETPQTGMSLPASFRQKTGVPMTQMPSVAKTVAKPIQTTKKMSPLFNSCLPLLLLAVGILLAAFLLSIAGLDTKLVKATLRGMVVDEYTNQPVEGASLVINEVAVATTNANGEYVIKGLGRGKLTIKISAKDYFEQLEEINLENQIFKYSYEKDFRLKSSVVASVQGKFIAPAGYDFGSDELKINDNKVEIKNDGSFKTSVLVGETTLKFTSISFKDVGRVIEIKAGLNTIQDITLVPAGDLIGNALSYVREDIVLDINFLAENVTPNQISVSQDGVYLVKDLEVGREYKIRVEANGYETRDYSITVTQGKNQLFDFKLVEEGHFIYSQVVGKTGSQIFRSDFDGIEPSQLSEQALLDPVNIFYDQEAEQVYFQSDFERDRSSMIGYVLLPYSINLEDRKLEKLSTDTTDYGEILANFEAGVMANITDEPNARDVRKLEVMKLDGSERKLLKRIVKGEIEQVKISSNGEFVFFYEIDETSATRGFYRAKISNSELSLPFDFGKFNLVDVSKDGNRALFTTLDTATGFTSLRMYDYNTNETRNLMNNVDGKDYQFKTGSDNIILFYANKEGVDNIYSFSIEQNKEGRLTTLTIDDKINGVFQQGRFIFYKTNKGVYVLDYEHPRSYKKVM